MDNSKSSYPWKTILGIAIIIFAILVLFFAYQRKHKETLVFQTSTDQLSPTDTPLGLPLDLPIEPGTKVLQNYQSTTNDGRMQSTKQITSYKGTKEAIDFYVDFFKKAGWEGGLSQISGETAETQLSAQMRNADGDLIIIARPHVDKQTSVEFTLIQSTK